MTKTQYIVVLTLNETPVYAVFVVLKQTLKTTNKNLKRRAIVTKKITIFTTNTCAYCPMVKRYLDSQGLNYEVVNLEEHPHRQEEALKISGSLTVPITVVTKPDDTQRVVVGYNLAQLAPAVA